MIITYLHKYCKYIQSLRYLNGIASDFETTGGRKGKSMVIRKQAYERNVNNDLFCTGMKVKERRAVLMDRIYIITFCVRYKRSYFEVDAQR